MTYCGLSRQDVNNLESTAEWSASGLENRGDSKGPGFDSSTLRNINTRSMFIAKPDTWFKAGTVVELAEDLRDGQYNVGIFEGTYIVGSCNPEGYDKFWYDQGFKDGDEVVMRELCQFGEFDDVTT